jgi:DNA-damage-inducible protein J
MCPGSDSINVAVLNHAVGDYAAQSSNHIPEPAMSKSAFLTARIEPKLKARASRVLAKVGVSTTDAITMFLSQVVLRGGLPFDVRTPNSANGTAIGELEAAGGETLHGPAKGIFHRMVPPRKKRKHEHPSIGGFNHKPQTDFKARLRSPMP